ncbi:nif-specific transcriptional activator NifA [Vibrio sp. MA40-2]|uniref:nif-specific transcriptional activator NifA n=1 Tax=Vibrio sp. MA40-2 TaxID=3391828 RepID=UPI0039A5ACD5
MNMDYSIADLERKLLAAMYNISIQLNASLDYSDSSNQVLKILHEECNLLCGLLAIRDEKRDIMLVKSFHSPFSESPSFEKQISYKAGEGIIGEMLNQGSSIVIRNLGDDMRFADKLALYDYDKPFICVPLKDTTKNTTIGALSAQPQNNNDEEITLLSRFLEMIANLITKHVQLAYQVNVEKNQLVNERDGLRRKVRNDYSFDNLVGHTKPMRKIFEQIRLVSKWDSTVLLRGESGTGKEVIANAIHYNSPRANNSFVKLNCAALPDNLLESELFGHEKGAFTGAIKQRKGRFELAHKGTIFLDEIGETSPAFQAKLLRVLQEQEFERVGGSDTISVDVRIIAATNRNLEVEVRDENFREDLYYRLNVMPMYLPTLKQRVEDIPELAQHMLKNLSKKQQRKLSMSEGAIRMLMDYSWPGNVRELENTLERAAILSESGVITSDTLIFPQFSVDDNKSYSATSNSLSTQRKTESVRPTALHNHTSPPSISPHSTSPHRHQEKIAVDERQAVIDALEQSGWVKAKAARLLNMTPRQIAYRIQIMNIEMKQI